MLGDTARRFAIDSRAATAIEYAIIAAGVSLAIIPAVYILGSAVQTVLYDKITAVMK